MPAGTVQAAIAAFTQTGIGTVRPAVLPEEVHNAPAIRKMAVEATDNGRLALEIAAGAARVKNAKSIVIRSGSPAVLGGGRSGGAPDGARKTA